MNRQKVRTTILVATFLIMCNFLNTSAQCKMNNTAFQAGEVLEYDLYMRLGFISTKGGFASLTTQSKNYNGKEAFKISLISESQGMARKLFALNDTLVSYTTKSIQPLAYFKDAHEGDDYTKEVINYTYGSSSEQQKIKIQTKRHKNGDFKFDEVIEAPGCTYDLVSILAYCRALDYASMKKGDQTKVNFISGKNRGSMIIEHAGTDKVKANDGKSYNTIKLILTIADEAFNNGKEAMKVYLSDDSNRIPVTLETKLKVGSTKAVLKSYKGNKYNLNISK